MLNEYLQPACTQGTPDTRRRRSAQEFGEQQADGVQQTNAQKNKRQHDEQAVVILQHLVVLEPLVHSRKAVVPGSRKSPRLALLSPVGVKESLHPRSGLRVRQLDPHLYPRRLGPQQLLESIHLLELPVLGFPGGAQLQCLAPAPRNVRRLRFVEMTPREIIEARLRLPLFEHADDAKVLVVPADGAADAVHATEQPLVEIVTENDDRLRAGIRSGVPTTTVAERHLEHRKEIGAG